jgi:polyisoprenoid-binding protein YceI
MASKVTSTANGGIRAWLLPEINEIKISLERINGEIKVLDTKIESTRNELKVGIARVESRVEDLDKRLDVVQRLAL